MSRNLTSWALRWINARRASTSSPISTLKSSSDCAASSSVICRSTRLAGSIVVSHRSFAFISEALEPLHAVARPGILASPGDARLDHRVPLRIRIGVAGRHVPALPLDLVERRLGEVDMPGLDQRLHEP